MALILALETATKNCSVALIDSGNVLALEEEYSEKYSHAEQLNVFIENVLKKADKSMKDISAVAVSKGPGSYTGLRIGVSTAKGLCYALGIPLISVSTLEGMANGVRVKHPDFEIYVPMIDARRMEVFTQSFDETGKAIDELRAAIIDENSFDHLGEAKTIFFGDGAEKCAEVLSKPNFTFVSDFHPSARNIAILADQKLKENEVENVAYFEPFYLKDFITGPPKKPLQK